MKCSKEYIVQVSNQIKIISSKTFQSNFEFWDKSMGVYTYLEFIFLQIKPKGSWEKGKKDVFIHKKQFCKAYLHGIGWITFFGYCHFEHDNKKSIEVYKQPDVKEINLHQKLRVWRKKGNAGTVSINQRPN